MPLEEEQQPTVMAEDTNIENQCASKDFFHAGLLVLGTIMKSKWKSISFPNGHWNKGASISFLSFILF